ncbi:MAG TPA: hypothetical protein VHZ55_25515 [Bryobacteraceae bacterium]|nr:hypothetical protein [Bryobacteraceae bacterium]
MKANSDVGEVLHAGLADYDAASKTYTLTGSGGDNHRKCVLMVRQSLESPIVSPAQPTEEMLPTIAIHCAPELEP